jgi:phage shock protein C
LDNIKRLYRSDDAMVAGICSGFAEYFGIDATIARILAVIMLVLLVGTPIPLYLILIFIIPKRPLDKSRPIDVKASASSEMSAIRNQDTTPGAAWVSTNSEAFDAVDPNNNSTTGKPITRGLSAAIALGLLLVGFGIIALLGLVVDSFFWQYWPLVIILVGLITLFTPGYNGWRVSRAGYGILVITIGTVLQLWQLGYYGLVVFWYTFWTLWPIGLIGLGLLVIGGTLRRDFFKLAAALLVSLTIAAGVWSFGWLDNTDTVPIPLFKNELRITLPQLPFQQR